MPSIGSALGKGAVSGGLTAAGNPRIDNNAPPPMKTLVYAPSARIIVAHGNRQYDLSGDLVNGGVVRPENAAASVAWTCNNRDLRYNGLFDRMDRVIVFLKRVKSIQVFSGYLDDTPYLQLYPGTVTFRATCTMKRLMHTWWDVSLPDSQALFQSSAGAGGDVVGDGTTTGGSLKPIGSIIRDILTEVGGWDADKIQIENFPMKFLTLVKQWTLQNAAHDKAQIDKFLQLMLGDDHSAGVGASASANPALTLGPPVIGAPGYIATMIQVADSMGMGPTTTDLQTSQQIADAASQLSGSIDASTQSAGKALEGAAQSWNKQYRNTDAAILALACSMVETEPGPRNLANPGVETSLTYPNDGVGSDGTSVGLYQQISGGQWGDVAQRMNPQAATKAFLLALNKIDWHNMDPGTAIQTVQQSAFPGKYSGFIQAATQIIQAARSASNEANSHLGPVATANSPLSPTNLLGTALGATALAPSVGVAAGGSSPTSASQLAGASKPNPDAMQAIAAGLTYVGSPYDQIRPPVRGVGVDCSGLTSLAYKSIGIDIGGNTIAQIGALQGKEITAAQIQPGDLVFPSEGHTFMYLGSAGVVGGPPLILESSGADWHKGGGPSPDGPQVKPLHYDLSSMYRIFHVADFGGWDPTVKFNEPSLMGPGYSPGTFGTSNIGTGYSADGSGGQGKEPVARNLFTYQFNFPAFAPKISPLFDGERSLLNCDPIITTIQALCKATLRNWCSSPTGDFVAWYPDYFGLDGKQAVMYLEDIEMKDVTINLSDYSLITHAYVAVQTVGSGMPVGPEGWLQSGVASVENEALFQQMAKIAPQLGEGSMSGNDILAKFGARPFMQEYDMVQSTELRQLLAIHHFMEGWANQFSSDVQFTFMPELFPGMRINLQGHNLQVYVSQVQHTFDYTNGFHTQATVTAPSVPRGVSDMLSGLAPDSVLEKFTDLLQTFGMG